jgi:beta-glucosidase
MLTNSEKQTYDILKQYFDHIVLVLNVGSMIQLNNIEKDQKTSILISYYPGMEAGNAIVDVLVGDVNPSAHLTSTWAKTINDYPTTSTFIENINYVKYKEGLFVGYRYFEEDENTQSKVVFPFGHGLSYTTFDMKNKCEFDSDKKNFKVTSTIKNTGQKSGKQVVQVYVKKPQNEKFVKVQRELVAFGKTKN